MNRNIGIPIFMILLLNTLFLSPFSYAFSSQAESFSRVTSSTTTDVTSDPIYLQLKSGNRVIEGRSYRTPDQPTVYLTFDDGPSELTSRVLDILQKENVKATFFVLGQYAEKRPEIIQRIINEGHAIGNHTYNHEYQQIYSRFDEYWEQIRQTEEMLQQIAGVRPKLIRAPGGTYTNFDAFYFYYLEQAGYIIHDWNVDSGDSRRRGVPAEEIIRNIKNSMLHHELNVLLHDGPGHEESVKALPDIIRYYKNQGYQFAILDEHVKPIQFQVSQNKWGRMVTKEDYWNTMEQIQEDMMHNPTELNREVPFVQPAKDSLFKPSHMMEWPGSTIWKVPLRAMVERLGGYVDWNEEERKATIRYQTKHIEFYIDTPVVKVYAPDRLIHKTIAQIPFTVENGSIHITLHDFEQLIFSADV